MGCGAAEATGLGLVLLLSTLVCCQPTEKIKFKTFQFYPLPQELCYLLTCKTGREAEVFRSWGPSVTDSRLRGGGMGGIALPKEFNCCKNLDISFQFCQLFPQQN